MPKKNFDTIWKAPPHTIAKIQILRDYFYVYLQILGSTSAENILYIDGFSGPGEYTNDPNGSPVAAMEAALASWRSLNHKWNAGPVWLAFIERNRRRVEHLTHVLRPFNEDSLIRSGAVKYRIFRGTFAEQIEEVKKWCPEPFATSQPLFAFVDPFGATDVPFDLVQEILSTPCSEMLLNLSVYGARRIFRAKHIPANARNLDIMFGAYGDKDTWRDWLHDSQSFQGLAPDILRLYKHRLLNETMMKYVFACEMAKTATDLDYYLVFATGHPKGMIRMKESMGRIVDKSSYRFIDAIHGVGQVSLFDDVKVNRAEIFAPLFHRAYLGQTVGWQELEKWALNESPFTGPSSMLRVLQNDDLISVTPVINETIRKGGFPKEKIASITFKLGQERLF